MKYIVEKALRLLPDRLYLQLLYFKHMKKFINFKNPVSFSEKIQWLKLHDRNPLYITLVDKIAVKKYVAEKIGEKYIIPTLGVWNKPEDIIWENLPNQFVIKWNHDSGSIIICKDKSKFNRKEAIGKLRHGATFNGFWYGREWPYKNVNPLIFAEKYMFDGESELTDYKFFCFDGEPKYCQVIKDRSTKETIDFFDLDWNHQEFIGLNRSVNFAQIRPIKPKCYEEMIILACKLSSGFPFSRVDLYEINGDVYFGEITFYPASGIGGFTPSSYDKILGNMIQLPLNKE
ncbi:MAG: glycosyl transferase [Bacteroidaceae bacterium]|nr:glycosyl transferase [Bacteroidaceae bacterium]